jgi:uncharacterized protein YoxC
MYYLLASTPSSSPIAAWGQAAAIILVIELFFFVLIGLALTFALMFALSWVREKAELIKKLRPTVEGINTTTEEAIHGALPPPKPDENKLVRTIAEVPAKIEEVEKKVDEGSDRVAKAVIEFRARTEMVEGIVKTFLMPKSVKRLQSRTKDMGFKSPGYRILVEENVPEAPDQTGGAFVGTIKSTEIKDASTA